MSKFYKSLEAGPLVVECVYPAPAPREAPEVRAGKRRLSSEAQKRMNLKNAWQKLELLIAANFGARDLWCTLTFDDEHLPRSRAQALARVGLFFRRLRKARTRRGRVLKYLYTVEHRHGDGRWHVHLLLNATGDDFRDIAGAWGAGLVDIRRIRVDRERNFESLAKYMCKEQRDKVGQRLWSGSRNLAKPSRECRRVAEDVTLQAPRGAVVLGEASERTVFGVYRWIKYLLPEGTRRRRFI